MEYRRLGESELTLSAITFGAWAIGGWMWGGSERKDAINAIKAAYEHGVTSIDTAPIYGQGLSEEIVGEAIQGMPRNKIQVLTKFGMRWDSPKGQLAFKSQDNFGNSINIHRYAGKESILKECEDSLRRLKTDYIDLYQIHWPDTTTPIEESMEALTQLKKEGKILAAGVCNYNAEQMKTAAGVISLASNQVPYSMVERGIEKELAPYCIENAKGILAYSPLQRGILTGKIKTGHQFATGDHRPGTIFYQPENIKRINAFLSKIESLAKDKNISLSQLVLRWTIQQPGITIALAGARDAKQAVQNAGAGELMLSAEEVGFIDRQLQQLELAG
jgi:aryl-alcohol dehydrogenase-like predicted oxidoreductase